jgi:hypothetical protein
MADSILKEFEELTEVEQLRAALGRTEAQLKRAKARSENLVAATLQGAHDAVLALGPLPIVPRPALVADHVSDKEEVALWHLTDWQGSKVTTSYNSTIMRERVLHYCDKAALLTEIQRAHHPVKKCVIMFGGDMGEGIFNFPQQVFEIDATLFDQFAMIARLEVEVVRRALAIYDDVEIVSEFGNHGRIGSKRAAVPLADNFDRMAYHLARVLIQESADAPRVVWKDSIEDIQHVEIGAYRALLIHGDEVGRNGFASRNTIVSHIGRWQSGAHDWVFRDAYYGHYHSHSEDSLPNGYGTVFGTGSPESDSRYASVSVAAGSRPSQRLHFIDPVKGRVSCQYRVWLTDEDTLEA